jgi:hypothetical protein
LTNHTYRTLCSSPNPRQIHPTQRSTSAAGNWGRFCAQLGVEAYSVQCFGQEQYRSRCGTGTMYEMACSRMLIVTMSRVTSRVTSLPPITSYIWPLFLTLGPLSFTPPDFFVCPAVVGEYILPHTLSRGSGNYHNCVRGLTRGPTPVLAVCSLVQSPSIPTFLYKLLMD